MNIDFNQSSTKRGIVWVATFIIGSVGWWMGKDVTGIILLGSGIAGGLGAVESDK